MKFPKIRRYTVVGVINGVEDDFVYYTGQKFFTHWGARNFALTLCQVGGKEYHYFAVERL